MKTILKSVLTLGLVAGLGFVANAQNGQQQSVTATATIQDVLEITKTGNVAFGNLPATTFAAVFLDPTGDANAFTGSGASISKIKIDGSAGAEVKVEWQSKVDLLGQTDDSEKIIYEVLVHGMETDTQASSEALGIQGTAASADVTLHTDGNYFLFIGGGFPALTGALSSQTYSGEFNFSFEYN